MSLKYSIAELQNSIKPDEPSRFYARSQTRENVGMNEIAEEASYATTLTDGDVLNVLRALIHSIKNHLAAGDCVDLGEFGKFRYHISSAGAISKEAFNSSYIRNVKLRFQPGKLLKPSLSQLKFERVLPVNVVKRAKQDV